MTNFTSVFRLSPSLLLMAGVALVCIGGLGDIVYHSLPAALAYSVEPLVGTEGVRAHVVTLIGMFVGVAGVIGRGLRR